MSILETSPDSAIVIDLKNKILDVSPKTLKLLKYDSIDEVIGRSIFDFIAIGSDDGMNAALKKVLQRGVISGLELSWKKRDNSVFVGESDVILVEDEKGKHNAMFLILRDVTERKESVEVLRKSEERYRRIVENTPNPIFSVDKNGIFKSWNRACEKIFQYDLSIIGLSLQSLFPHEVDMNLFKPILNRVFQGHSYKNTDISYKCKDGTILFMNTRLYPLTDEKGVVQECVFANTNVTDRMQAEKIQNVLYNIAHAVSASDNLDRLMKTIHNQLSFLIDTTNFFITLYDPETDRYSFPYYVDEHDKLEEFETRSLRKSLTDYVRRTGEPLLADKDVFSELEKKKEIELIGTPCFAWLGVPLKLRDEVIGVVVVQSYSEKTKYSEKDLRLLNFVSGHIALAVERKKTESELKKSFQKVQRSLETTIEAIAKIVEIRDPYTAGHQQRVAQLSCAIAREMQLPEDRILGIRTAALIHDIGKLFVPAEILIRPSRLTKLEFELVQNHSRYGYDILKSIDFPWPVADIILQHHEHYDGSGYPSGLKKKEILLEARILGVADFVEAKSSDRPYRPARRLEQTLEELDFNNGKLYDPDVVNACLTIFREKRFQFF